MPGQCVCKTLRILPINGIADVFHVALGGLQDRAVLAHDVDRWMLMMKPSGRRQAANVEEDLDARAVQLVDDGVGFSKRELSIGGFEPIPRQVSDAHQLETRRLHERNVAMNLLWGAVDRLIAGPDDESSSARPVGGFLDFLRSQKTAARRKEKSGSADQDCSAPNY